ncbi:MAG: hypothetical protein E7606_04525 [Ruminococcaceae bacterium]|nr:hypothetical protein [Oscillospiraceae bacterium]
MKKTGKIIALLLALLLVLPLTLTSCGAPELEEVKDRFVELIEASYAINDIFFGAGLETYARDGEFATTHRLYDELSAGYAAYEIVSTDTGYLDVNQIKEAAAKVYSPKYLDGVYTMAFDGYADSTSGTVVTARYLMDGMFLLRYADGKNDPFDFLDGAQRRYLFDTMKIIRPSRAKYVNLSIDSYLVGDEDNILNVHLRFVLVDGVWYLDSPTY